MSDATWDDDPIVVTTGYYADEVDLWSCLTCGALVRGLFKEMHKAYHAGGAR